MRTIKNAAAEKEYTRLIGKCPILTREEEYAAWKRGDTELLVQSQLAWVMRIAITICRQRKFHDTDLAISAGNVALLRSIRDFDGDRGYRLTTFVYRMVVWDVCKEVDRAAIGVGPSKGIKQRRGITISSLPKRDEGLEYDVPAIEDRLIEGEQSLAVRVAVRNALRKLPPHYRVVVRGRMEGKKFAEIAEAEGVTKQAIQQRWDSAVRQLQFILKHTLAA